MLLPLHLNLSSPTTTEGSGVGFQDTAILDRFHYTLPPQYRTLHYTVPGDRAHFTAPFTAQFDFTTPADRLHFTIREEQP